MSIAYLNGEFQPREKACVPVMDRGFLFGDGVYEVIPVYGGRLFRLDQHLQRLAGSLDAIRLGNPLDNAGWRNLLEQLVERTRRDRNRPLLQDTDPRTKLESIMKERGPLYRQVADLIVKTDHRTVRSVVKEILKRLVR